MPTTVNLDKFYNVDLKRAVNSIANLAKANVERQVSAEKNKLLDKIDKDKTSEELNKGYEDRFYQSPQLGGYGNLYSFIGFEGNYNPVETVKILLEDQIQLKDKRPDITVKRNQSRVLYRFHVETPSQGDMEAQTPYQGWGDGSWLRGIENGISGFRYYLFSVRGFFSSSRSGPAIQAKHQIRSFGNFIPRNYVLSFLKEFRDRLRKL